MGTTRNPEGIVRGPAGKARRAKAYKSYVEPVGTQRRGPWRFPQGKARRAKAYKSYVEPVGTQPAGFLAVPSTVEDPTECVLDDRKRQQRGGDVVMAGQM